jgi:hypothetical protein
LLPPFQIRERKGTEDYDEINRMVMIVNRRVTFDIIPRDVIEEAARYSGGIISEFLDTLIKPCIKAIDNEIR